MASGTPVIASDIPALREVGGVVAEYCPVGDVGAWSRCGLQLMREYESDSSAWQLRRHRGIEQASRFSWTRYAEQMLAIYRRLLG
jgi:glycosyltransferase involved in cell wall biosynthesis